MKEIKRREYQAYLESKNDLAYERRDRNYIVFILIRFKNMIRKLSVIGFK
jgi:hypothetical protein